jgi:hypothetical protein
MFNIFSFGSLVSFKLGLLLLASILGVTSKCSDADIAGSNVSDQKIRPEELTGTWTFNDTTSNQIDRWRKSIGVSKLSAEENTIEIRRVGTCHFKAYWAFHPKWAYVDDPNGRWVLKKEYDHGLGAETWIIHFDLRHGIESIGAPFYLKRMGNRLTMYTFADDPDTGEVVEFERKAR